MLYLDLRHEYNVCSQLAVPLHIYRGGGPDPIISEVQQDNARNGEDLATHQDSHSN
jgi:hypothetical protein